MSSSAPTASSPSSRCAAAAPSAPPPSSSASRSGSVDARPNTRTCCRRCAICAPSAAGSIKSRGVEAGGLLAGPGDLAGGAAVAGDLDHGLLRAAVALVEHDVEHGRVDDQPAEQQQPGEDG